MGNSIRVQPKDCIGSGVAKHGLEARVTTAKMAGATKTLTPSRMAGKAPRGFLVGKLLTFPAGFGTLLFGPAWQGGGSLVVELPTSREREGQDNPRKLGRVSNSVAHAVILKRQEGFFLERLKDV